MRRIGADHPKDTRVPTPYDRLRRSPGRAFFGIDGDSETVAAGFALPTCSVARDERRKRVIDELNATAEPALSRFGYL